MSCYKDEHDKCGFNKCREEKEVCYYECKCNDGFKKCKTYIKETAGLIENIEKENKSLEKGIASAYNNQLFALGSIDKIEKGIECLSKLVVDLASGLKEVQCGLYELKHAVNVAEEKQKDALRDIGALKNDQEAIEKLVDELEASFARTVKCLGRDGNNCPILIPVDDCDKDGHHDCHHDCHKDCPWEK